ncbi:MAG: malonate-semialdehyde dehydrogenase, partial [Bacillota bacterium]
KNLEESRGDIIKAIEVVELACAAPVLMQGDSLMNVSEGHDTVPFPLPAPDHKRAGAAPLHGCY